MTSIFNPYVLRLGLVGFLFTFMVNFQVFAQLTNQPEQNCGEALEICQMFFQQTVSYEGNGTIKDVDPAFSCLTNGENSSVWYIFTVTQPGLLIFELTPLAGDDYDFALYDLSGLSCADLTAGIAQEVRCNFAASTGPTGLSINSTSTSSSPNGDPLNAPVSVLAGETYVLLVDNFARSKDGYTLDFTNSTASILDTVSPEILTIDSMNCENTDSLIINFSEPVKCATIDAAGSNFSITSPGGAPSVTIDTVVNRDCDNSSFTSEVIIFLASPITVGGNYSMQLVVGNSGQIKDNCDNDANLNAIADFFVPEMVIADFSFTTSAGCNSDSLLFINTSVGNFTSEFWDFGDGTDTNAANPTKIYADTGIYTVTLTVAADPPLGCNATDSAIVVATKSVDLGFAFSPTQPCVGQLVTFTDTSVFSGSVSYWEFGDGNISNQPNSVTNIYMGGGSFTVKFFKSDPNALCIPDTIERVINIRDTVIAGFTLTNIDGITLQDICVQEEVVFTSNSSGTPTSTLWDFGGIDSSNQSSYNITFDSVGNYLIVLTVSDTVCLTTNTVSQTVVVRPRPVVMINDTSLCLDESVTLFSTTSTVDSTLWSTGETTPSIVFTDVPNQVWAIAWLGSCSDSDTATIAEKPTDSCSLAPVPSAFSPNGDGINDRLNVLPERVLSYEITVFNRWGEEVKRWTNGDSGWDGNYKDAPQPIGTYAYYIAWVPLATDQKPVKQWGTVTLIR